MELVGKIKRYFNLSRFVVSAKKSDSLRKCYDSSSSIYSSIFEKNQEYFAETMLRTIRKQGFKDCGNALDLGAGTGILTRKLQDISQRVTGLDFSYGMIEQAISKGKGSKLEYLVGDVLSLPLAEKRYDLITSLGLQSHIPKERFSEFIYEINRVAKDSSAIIIGMTPLPWRLFAARKNTFDISFVDRWMIKIYNSMQKKMGMDERRGVYHFETFEKELSKYNYSVELFEKNAFVMIYAERKK